jgi:hypothetical protein
VFVVDEGDQRNAPAVGSRGECDHEAASSTLSISTTTVILENVQADGTCFDLTLSYPGFKTEGRGKMSQDGRRLSLEMFFAGQATGHRCANGSLGARTVTLNGQPFTGNAVQVYTLSP